MMAEAADAIIDLYDRRARDWQMDRGRDLFERSWLDRFAALLAPGASVLDIGCGTGEPIARYFMDSGYAVTGIDSGANMIAICRETFPQGNWIVGDMRAMDLGRVFDGLIAWHSLIHIRPDDQAAVFAGFASCAVSGAPLIFTSGTERGEHIGQWQGEALYHGSLSSADYRDLLESNGFDLIKHVEDDPACGHANVWLARKR